MSAPAKYSRDELARLEASLRRIIAEDAGTARRVAEDAARDLAQTADFLAETVAVLDRQKRLRDRRKAQNVIERKKRRRSR